MAAGDGMGKIKIEKIELYQINEIESHRVSGTFYVEYTVNGRGADNINVSVVAHSREISESFDFRLAGFYELEKILVERAKEVFREMG